MAVTLGGSNKLRRITVDWTSDGSGDATDTVTIDGVIVRLITDPAAGGAAPDDDYDVTVVDEFGLDLLDGQGANRDTAVTEHVLLAGGLTTTHVYHEGSCTVTIANAGATNQGQVVLFVAWGK